MPFPNDFQIEAEVRRKFSDAPAHIQQEAFKEAIEQRDVEVATRRADKEANEALGLR